MVRQRKIYPGERQNASLDRFSRVPKKSAVTPTFQPVYYESEAPPPISVEPTSPFRIILGGAGVLLAVIVILILMFGGGAGGLLDGASQSKRLILASFTAVLTLVLLVVANPHGRLKAIMVGLAFAAGLLTLPFFFKEGTSKVTTAIDGDMPDLSGAPALEPMEDPLKTLKEEMHYEPVEEALAAYGPTLSAQGKTAVGIWLRDLRDFNKLQVVEYLTRSTNASEASWLYPRPPDDFLMVLIDIDDDMEKVAQLCGRFGKVTRMIEELRVIEVKVANESFIQGSLDALSDLENPSFYELNRRELESIDLRRVEEAVRRLATAEPKLYRKDVVRRMQELYDLADTEMKSDLAKALGVWSEPGDGSVDVVREAAAGLMAEEKTVPRPIIEFLVKQKDEQVIPILDQLWAGDPGAWENLYGEMGSPIEDLVLGHFNTGSPTIKISAATLLTKVGTAKSLPALRKAQESAKSETAVVVGRAIDAIEGRR
ncbi:hypothetical protein ACFQY0_06265 [Haloferula chungangensis]|uniref:HEAT repeat domain-containing protein n=1 Tax=Haloferula chungangensis TaxID=1048331 RepID=A0ABW2L4U9_9BACT